MSWSRLTNYITVGKLSLITRPAFKMEEYVTKLSKRELEFTYYNYGYLSSKTKHEVYWVLNKHTVNRFKKYVIKKYYEQNQRTLTVESIEKSEPIKGSKIDIKEDTINHYEPDKN